MERVATGAAVGGEPLRQRRAQLDLFGHCADEGGAATGCGPLSLPWDDDGSPGMPILETYSRVRGAVVSMVTAAHLHGLLCGPPRTLWLGAPLRVHVPKRGSHELRTIRWSNRQAFEVGVADLPVPGGTVRCTVPERTIIDLIRYSRHAGGTSTAIRCLQTYVGSGGSEVRIRQIADALRVSRPARVILDTLLLGMEGRP